MRERPLPGSAESTAAAAAVSPPCRSSSAHSAQRQTRLCSGKALDPLRTVNELNSSYCHHVATANSAQIHCSAGTSCNRDSDTGIVGTVPCMHLGWSTVRTDDSRLCCCCRLPRVDRNDHRLCLRQLTGF